MERISSRPSNSLEDYLLRKSEPNSYDRRYNENPELKNSDSSEDIKEKSDDLYKRC